MRNLRHIIPFLVALFCLAFPNISRAQEANWPWLLDGENFTITGGSANSFFPSIASNGQIYFVVWHQQTDSGFCIYGARVTKGGDLLDPDGIPICSGKNDQMYPSVAWDGVNFLVVWQDRRSGTQWDIYGARVNPEANREEAVLDPDGIPVAVGKSSYDQVSPTLSFDGENYLVVWQGKKNSKARNIYFSMVSKEGKIIKKPALLSPFSKDQAFPSVSFNGEFYLVVWQEKRSNQFWGIVGAIVSPSGEIANNGEEIQISPAVGQKIQWDRWKPEVSWNGEFYLIIWTSQREKDQWSVEGRRFQPYSTEDMDSEDLVLQRDSTSNVFPAILWDDQKKQYLLLWEDDAAGESIIEGASLQMQYDPFVKNDPVPISTSDARNASIPRVSSIGDKILIIWGEVGPEGNWQVYGQRLKRVPDLPVGPR
jgi:hypothetical protein